ncbi:MAG: hypothetical protein R3B47_13330 [Bacteroidia bacterium]
MRRLVKLDAPFPGMRANEVIPEAFAKVGGYTYQRDFVVYFLPELFHCIEGTKIFMPFLQGVNLSNSIALFFSPLLTVHTSTDMCSRLDISLTP